jgi:hypothetical protein
MRVFANECIFPLGIDGCGSTAIRDFAKLDARLNDRKSSSQELLPTVTNHDENPWGGKFGQCGSSEPEARRMR